MHHDAHRPAARTAGQRPTAPPTGGQGSLDAPADPPILTLYSGGGYSALWLVYVTAVDLGEHCMNCLIGQPSRRIDRLAAEQTHRLDEHPEPLAYYLCGVTQPYSWAENAHLAFRAAPGEHWHGAALVPGLVVTLENALPIPGWGPDSIPAGAPHAGERLYRTCRNWQFAWYAHRQLGAEDRENPAKYKHARRYRPPVGIQAPAFGPDPDPDERKEKRP